MRLIFFLLGTIFIQIFFIIRNTVFFGIQAIIIYALSRFMTSKKLLIAKDKLIYNFLSIMFIETFINIFVKNMLWTLFLSYTLFYVLSLAFYYLHEFRGNSLYFADIFCIATAKEVAGGYNYDIKIEFVISFVLNIVLLYVFRNSNYMSNNLFILYRIALALFFYAILRIICSQNKFNYSLNAGEKEGYIYNFISSCPIFYIDLLKLIKGKEYLEYKNNIELSETLNINATSENKIAKLKAPHVIVIMNESFSHINERIKTNIDVTPVYDNLKGVVKGNLLVNTFGGGTETTEFEFLTAMHVGSNPYPIYPYNNIKSEKFTMARFFDNLGYRTIAMHPYTATNYHRNVIYKLFGFKDLFFYEDFKHRDTVRNYVSDEAMYDEVIDKYEETKKEGKKCFLFGITMQNHSGYDSFVGQEVEVTESFEEKKSLNSYLSLLHISDKSIKKLIDYFDKEKERVLICFFGDHNASFSPSMNEKIYDISNYYEGKNVYETPFFIYDNKNKVDENIKQISTNFLAVELIKRTGLELTDYYKLIDKIYSKAFYMNFHKEKMRENNLLYYIEDIEKEYMEYKKEFLK